LFAGGRSRPVDRRMQRHKPRRLRDRGILLMLARLGLPAADVACPRLNDINWNNGTLQVKGKGDTKCGCHSRRMSATLCSAIWNAGPATSIPIISSKKLKVAPSGPDGGAVGRRTGLLIPGTSGDETRQFSGDETSTWLPSRRSCGFWSTVSQSQLTGGQSASSDSVPPRMGLKLRAS
jgi:hypothetical protein